MTWTLPFLFIRLLAQLGGRLELTRAPLSFLLLLFFGGFLLLVLGVMARRSLLSFYRTRTEPLVAGRLITSRYR